MAKNDNRIRIRIKTDSSERRFQPGEQITGNIEIFPDSVIRCQAVEISLMWYTEGKGRRDEGIVQTWRYDVQQITPEQGFNEPFEGILPSAPWSYAGQLINVVWAVHAKVDIPMAPDINNETRFLLLPADVPDSV